MSTLERPVYIDGVYACSAHTDSSSSVTDSPVTVNVTSTGITFYHSGGIYVWMYQGLGTYLGLSSSVGAVAPDADKEVGDAYTVNIIEANSSTDPVYLYSVASVVGMSNPRISHLKVGSISYDIAGQIPFASVTGTSTAFVTSVSGVTGLTDGVALYLHNGVATTASGITLNVNSLGAKNIYDSKTGNAITNQWELNSAAFLIYNSTRASGSGGWDMYAGMSGGASPSSALPQMDGVASAGTAVTFARGDHVHPTNTSGRTMTGALVCQNNTDYTTKQARNIFIVASGATVPAGANGDICLIY